YQWDGFGIAGGATIFEGWNGAGAKDPHVGGFPDLELCFGRRSVAFGVLGIGSPLVTTLRRPGAYLGMDIAAGAGDGDWRFGAFRAGPSVFEDTSARVDLVVLVPITRAAKVRFGASASGNDAGTGGEGSLGFAGSL